MRRNILIAICLLLIVLLSTATVFWLTQRQVPDTVVLKSYTSLPKAVQSLLRGDVDLLPIDEFDLQTLRSIENNSQVKLVSIPSYDFTYIGLNLRNWPLSYSHFRKTMLYALNRTELLTKALGNFGESLNPGLFSSAYSTSGWKRYTTDQYRYNITSATRLLDSDGFSKSSYGPFRIDPSSGEPLRTMFILSRLTEPDEVATADLFAKNMQRVGLPIISLPMSDIDFRQALRNYSFDIFIDSSTNNFAPTWLYTLFESKNDISPTPLGTNVVGYSNPRFDSYVSQVMSTSNQSELQNAMEKCQEILSSDLPILPVFSKNILVAANARLNVIPVIGSLEDTIRKTAINITQSPKFSSPLRIGFAHGFQSLDPTTTSNQADWIALRLVTEPLLTLDEKGKFKPALAEWTQSFRSITLRIRPGAKFDTGQNITANDVVATLNWLVRNVRPSSSIYPAIREIARIDLIDPSTLRILLSSANKFAIYAFTDLFVLPASRITANPFTPDFLASQLLVSSGPFTLREFTQTQGVYMKLNDPYFGKPTQNMETFDAFKDSAFLGAQVFQGSLVEISSSQMVIDGQPVANASYVACVYDQNDVQTQCTRGIYKGQGAYSTSWRVDSKFHLGTYRVESTLYWTLPNGKFVAFKETAMRIRPLPLLQILIGIALIGGVIAIALTRRQRKPRRRRVKRRVSRRTSRRASR